MLDRLHILKVKSVSSGSSQPHSVISHTGLFTDDKSNVDFRSVRYEEISSGGSSNGQIHNICFKENLFENFSNGIGCIE